LKRRWKLKDTGRPISQKELANIPQDQRVTQGDFQIGQQEKQYTAEQEWTRQAREDALTRGIEQEERGYAADLEKEQERQAGMTKREKLKQEAASAKEASMAEKQAIKDKKREEKDRIAEEKKDAEKARKSKVERAKIEDKLRKEYKEYSSGETGELPVIDEGGFFSDAEIAKPLPYEEWIKEFKPHYYELFYTDKPEEIIANGEKSAGSSPFSEYDAKLKAKFAKK
jgi:hypothetical protein